MLKILKKWRTNRSKGFTMMEMLVTVGIITVVSGITVTGVVAIKDNLAQKSLDEKAQIIYESVQSELTQLNAGGQNSLYSAEKLPELVAIPQKGNSNADNYSAEADLWTALRYLSNYEIKDETAVNISNEIVEGSCDDELYQNHWVIEMCPDTSTVYAVYYAESEGSENLGNALSGKTMNDLRELKGRKSAQVGYYDGADDELPYLFTNENSGNLNAIDASVDITNGDTLVANLSYTLPEKELEHKWSVTVSDGTNKIVITEENQEKYGLKFKEGPAGTFTAELLLDSLEKDEKGNSQRFTDLFPGLTPGKDITVTLNVTTDDPKVGDGEASATENSLFAEVSEDGEAEVSNLRHLQNLDEESGVDEEVKKAKLGSDIPGGPFEPINNDKLQEFDGNNYKIKDLVIGPDNKGSGLFGEFNGSEIKNLDLVNIKAGSETDPNAGTLMATYKNTAKTLTISNCNVYLDATKAAGIAKDKKNNPASVATDMTMVLIRAKANAGGLIGLAKGSVIIQNSSAATVVNGVTTAGGLVGATEKNLTVSGSYADNYLGSTSGKVGGLVGSAAVAVKVTDSYAAGYVTGANGKTYGLVGGSLTTDSKNVYSVCTKGNSVEPDYLYGTETKSATATDIYGARAFAKLVIKNKRPSFTSTWKTLFSQPYNLDTGARKVYPFPSMMAQHGDWDSSLMNLKDGVDLTLKSGVRTVWSCSAVSSDSIADITGSNGKTYANTTIKHIPATYKGSPYELEGWYNKKDDTGVKLIDADGTVLQDLTEYSTTESGVEKLTLYAKWKYTPARYQLVDTLHSKVNNEDYEDDYIVVVTNSDSITTGSQYALSRLYINEDDTEIRSATVEVKKDSKGFYIEAPSGGTEVWRVKYVSNLSDFNLGSGTGDLASGYIFYDPQPEPNKRYANALVSRWTGKMDKTLALVYSLDTKDSTGYSTLFNLTDDLGCVDWHYSSSEHTLFFGDSTLGVTAGKYLHLNSGKNITIFSRNYGSRKSHTFLFQKLNNLDPVYTFEETATLTLYNGSENGSNTFLGNYDLSDTGKTITSLTDGSGNTLGTRVSNIRSTYYNSTELPLYFSGWVVAHDESGTNQTSKVISTKQDFSDITMEQLAQYAKDNGGSLTLYARYAINNIYARAYDFENGGKYLLEYQKGSDIKLVRAKAEKSGLAEKTTSLYSKVTVNDARFYLASKFESGTAELVWTANGDAANGFTLSYNGNYMYIKEVPYGWSQWKSIYFDNSGSTVKWKYDSDLLTVYSTKKDKNNGTAYLNDNVGYFDTYYKKGGVNTGNIYIYRYCDVLYFYE